MTEARRPPDVDVTIRRIGEIMLHGQRYLVDMTRNSTNSRLPTHRGHRGHRVRETVVTLLGPDSQRLQTWIDFIP